MCVSHKLIELGSRVGPAGDSVYVLSGNLPTPPAAVRLQFFDLHLWILPIPRYTRINRDSRLFHWILLVICQYSC